MAAKPDKNLKRQIRLCRTYLCLAALHPFRAEADALPDPEPSATAATTILAPASVDSISGVIGKITILNNSIFDLDIPEEDKPLYRLANKAHITTRPGVIQQQLLFNEGDELTPAALKESERILRRNRYIQDADIQAVKNDDGTVDVNVRTSDVWTLIPRLSLSRSGGANNAGIGLKEMNLFGTGMAVEALYKSDVDRDSTMLKFADHNLGNSWYSLSAVLADNSDGHTQFLDLRMPFYSLESTGAHGFSALNNDQIDSLYENGDIAARFRHETESFEVFRGGSKGLENGWARRYLTGFVYDDHQFSAAPDDLAPGSVLPENRKLVYPFVGFEVVEDRFEETKNLEQVNRTEDRFLGTRVAARLGYASTTLGSDRNAWIVRANAQTGFGSSKKDSLILSSDLGTRIEDDGPQNLLLGVSARYYRRQSERRLFYASLRGTYGHNLDIDNQLLVGGDNGLRGYPLRYQGGDRAAILTLEQRFFTDWYPFRLFRVGGAVFFDAGKTWSDQIDSLPNQGLLRNVGLGLRLGNTRSGQGRMTHIDLAFPLDGDQSIKNVQLIIETKKSF